MVTVTAIEPGETTPLSWDCDHVAELVAFNGRLLTVDMSQVETLDLKMPHDVEQIGVNENNAVLQRLTGMATVHLTLRVPSAAIKWVERKV